MTAAAIATMATVEAATTTRLFYLVVPGRNRARLRARIDHLSFLATIWTPRCRSSTPVDISELRRTATAHGRFQRAIHRRAVQAAEMAAREMGGLSLAASCQKAQRRVGNRS